MEGGADENARAQEEAAPTRVVRRGAVAVEEHEREGELERRRTRGHRGAHERRGGEPIAEDGRGEEEGARGARVEEAVVELGEAADGVQRAEESAARWPRGAKTSMGSGAQWAQANGSMLAAHSRRRGSGLACLDYGSRSTHVSSATADVE